MNNLKEVKTYLEEGTLPEIITGYNMYHNVNDGVYLSDDKIIVYVAGSPYCKHYRPTAHAAALEVINDMSEWLVENTFEKNLELLKSGKWEEISTYDAYCGTDIKRHQYTLEPIIIAKEDDTDYDGTPTVFVNLPKIGSFYHWNKGVWLCNNKPMDNLKEIMGWEQTHDSYTIQQILELVEYYQSNK